MPQQLSDPPKVPARLWNWLRHATLIIKTSQPTQGDGILVSASADKGSVISVSGALANLPPPPTSGTFVLGAQDGAYVWFPGVSC